MRLNKEVCAFIKNTAKTYFGSNAKVYLFGSRTDDTKKGGDIDLYIETDITTGILNRKLKMLGALQKVLGDQKIDIVINNFKSKKYIFDIAKKEGVRL